MTATPRLRPYGGPAVLSYGFRPFFLLGALWAGIEILAWLPMLKGELSLATVFSPLDWHIHEMLFGFVPAVVAGFLLTAIPNWTGRLPLQGGPLLVLVLTWLAGRYGVTFSASLGWLGVTLLDCAFLALMAIAVAREIVAGKNWRNLKIVALLSLLGMANLAFHLEAHFGGAAHYSARTALAVVIMLIMVVGGRIIPSFTTNWLMQRHSKRLPAPFGRFDEECVMVSAGGLILWVVVPDEGPTGVMLIAASLFNFTRMYRWMGHRTTSDRLVLVLHVGFLFVPIGFLLCGLASFAVVAPSAGVHAWAAGAIGIMTLAVMSRASLGHTGRKLAASPGLQAVYLAATVAAVARICAALHAEWYDQLLLVAAAAWAAAFLGFAALYGPLLLRPKTVRGPQ